MKANKLFIFISCLLCLMPFSQSRGFLLEALLQEPNEFWIGNFRIIITSQEGQPVLTIPSYPESKKPTLEGGLNEEEPECKEVNTLYQIAAQLRRLSVNELRIRLESVDSTSGSVTYVDQSYSPSRAYYYSGSWEDGGSGVQVYTRSGRDVCERHTCVSNRLTLYLEFKINGSWVNIPVTPQNR